MGTDVHCSLKNVDKETKRRAIFVLECKGSSLSAEVEKIIRKYGAEYTEYCREVLKEEDGE